MLKLFTFLMDKMRIEDDEPDTNHHQSIEEPQQIQYPYKNRKTLKFYGYIPCDDKDKERGRPSCHYPTEGWKGEGEFANYFTQSMVSFPINGEYVKDMRDIISDYTDLSCIGKGNYWNPYFGQWTLYPLTKEYHDAVHDMCRRAVHING